MCIDVAASNQRYGMTRNGMTDVSQADAGALSGVTTGLRRRVHFVAAADILAMALVASLPWSTSATAVLIVLWLCAVLPVVDWSQVWRTARSAVGGLPLGLWLLAAASCLWSEAGWAECWRGLSSYHKLLLLPLLIVQFSRSRKGHWVVIAYLGSCAGVLAASYLDFAWPSLFGGDPVRIGIPAKDYATQSTEFAICAFALAGLAIANLRARRRGVASGCAALALLFLCNIVYVATARATLVVLLVLLGLSGWKLFSWKGAIIWIVTAGVAIAAIWASSPYLRTRVIEVQGEIQRYVDRNDFSSSGMRLEFWRKSARFIAEAPLLGHGVGSVRALFARDAVGRSGMSAIVTADPHNQVLKIGIELGAAGMVLLLALWAAHLWMFTRDAGLIAWFGLVVVAQNVVNSQFSTRLLDFTQGWTYVIAVGVLAGMLCRQSASRMPE